MVVRGARPVRSVGGVGTVLGQIAIHAGLHREGERRRKRQAGDRAEQAGTRREALRGTVAALTRGD
jgi:hypothetical protein